VPGCGRPIYLKGVCRGHYARRNGPDPLGPLRTKRKAGEVQLVGGLSLGRGALAVVRRVAAERGVSEHALLVEIVESWAKEQG
jgi:hypothetical protein